MPENDGGDNGESMEEKMRSMMESGKVFASKAKEQYSGMKDQVGSFRGLLKQGVKSAVESTNDALAKVEETTISIQTPVLESIKTAEEQGSLLASQGMRLYDRRHEYGPYIVGASAVAVGGLAALRGGRLPGVLAAALAGGVSYAAVYEPVPLPDLPDWNMGSGTKND
mmetsp:Transcript_91/g.387  ORF Transcript_91/g.387 Transcript_91/m.387 type:complete len:168 (+) Transcript_91:89-592(+)